MKKSSLPINGVDATWEALLPCPFCDSPAQMLASRCLSSPDYGSNATVICSRCGSGGPCVEPAHDMQYETMVRIAARRWNRRGSHNNASWKLERIAQILGSDYVAGAK